ncbi:MAG TPA: DHA2 family efflux MFS transporter permease subunit [Symbiobacteriaceae bacterium]|nr:DHA2 family efflux MFS transporter permease subunit [Symbiobacteriaceae bacterium]
MSLPTTVNLAESMPAKQKWIILVGLVITLFLAALDGTIVSTAQPAIIRQFHGIDLISWVTTGYLLASTAMVPILGNLSDLYGRKIIIMTSTVVFLVGSALSGAATSMLLLIFARVVQGAGAAGITAISFAVIADLWVPAERAQISGIISSVFGLAGVVGPFVGGWLTDHVSWRAVFYVNVPIGIVALTFVALKMPKLSRGVKSTVDWAGVTLLLVTVVPFLLGLTLDKNTYGWTSPMILGLFAVAAVGLVLFLVVESKVKRPLIPLHLFQNKTFTVAALGSMLFGSGFFGSIMYLAMFLVGVNGISATKAGSTLMPMMLGMVAGSVAASIIAQKTGRYKYLILAGYVLTTGGMYLMSTMNADTSLSQVIWRMVFLGAGIGPIMPLVNLAVTNSVPVHEMGVATSTRSFFQSIGQTLAVSIFGVMLSANLTAQMDTHFQPIRAELPAAFASQLDTAQLKNQIGGETSETSTADIGLKIKAEVAKGFATAREQLTLAIEKDDAAAQQALKANPLLPDQLKQYLQPGAFDAAVRQQLDAQYAQLEQALKSGQPAALQAIVANPQTPEALKQALGAVPPAALQNPQAVAGLLAQVKQQMTASAPAAVASAKAQALKAALAGLEQARPAAEKQGEELGNKVSRAIKESFAGATTPIFFTGMSVILLGFLVTLALPELPLRKRESAAVAPAVSH